MDLNHFSRINRTRCESKDGFNHKLNSWSASDWMTALVGEVGEAANIIKKLNRIEDGIPGNKGDDNNPHILHQQLADEIADAFIYLDLLAQSQGLNLSEIVPRKFNRTSDKVGSTIKITGVP